MIQKIQIDREYANELLELISEGNGFDWFWNEGTTHEYNTTGVKNLKTQDSPQFTHILFSNDKVHSNFYHFFSEMFGIIEEQSGYKIKKVIRVKANLMTQDTSYPDGHYSGAHIDNGNDNVFTFLYYLNDSDGDTVFFSDFLDGKQNHNITDLIEVYRETPQCGTGLLFKSNQLHSSTPPKLTNRRVVMNYVFEVYETNDTKL
jgi:hypothetical protein